MNRTAGFPRRRTDDCDAAILGLAATSAGLAARIAVLHRRCRDAEARLRAGDGSALIRALGNDLRRPLTDVIGHAEAARATSLEVERRDACLEHVVDGCRDLLHVVLDLCDLARIERDELPLHAIDCRLDDVLDQVVAEVRHLAQRKGLLIAIRVGDDVPQHVHVDPTRVAQVLRLALVATIRATAAGHTGIRVELSGRRLAFRVHGGTDAARPDHGPGIALATRLATALGGTLTRDDAADAFAFELPFEPAHKTPDAADPDAPRSRHADAAPPSRAARFAGRVLIVDDERDNQLLIRHVLQQFGVETRVVDNGRAALAAIGDEHFDLVLMDLQMPVLDGWTATAALRERGDRLPVVALTAHALAAERDRCTRAGCDDFLTKPLDRPSLLRVLGRFLERRDDD